MRKVPRPLAETLGSWLERQESLGSDCSRAQFAIPRFTSTSAGRCCEAKYSCAHVPQSRNFRSAKLPSRTQPTARERLLQFRYHGGNRIAPPRLSKAARFESLAAFVPTKSTNNHWDTPILNVISKLSSAGTRQPGGLSFRPGRPLKLLSRTCLARSECPPADWTSRRRSW